MAIDPEEKTGMLGCLAALAAIGATIAGVVWFSQQDFSSEPTAASDTRSGTALTRVDPVREKRVVKEAVKVGPESLKVNTEDKQDPSARAAGVTAAVQNLGPLADQPPREMPEVAKVFDRVLAAEPLCYEGRIARRAPSLFTPSGFAITYGADDYNGGDPLPRLEIFLDHGPAGGAVASYLSMTHRAFPEFPAHEVPVTFSEEALSAVIAKWVATVATETCPEVAPRGTSASVVD